jgi:dTDP-N-acetylfucosamine:lipid II N-acetylfucosaminyltransferase
MNLHIFLDEKFADPFINKISSLSLKENRFVINTENNVLKNVTSKVDYASLGTRKFDNLVGKASNYERVFFHYLNVGSYKWILTNSFKSLNWMVWGSDLYQLPFIRNEVILPMTKKLLLDNGLFDLERRERLVYRLKYKLSTPLVYSKIDGIYTWIKPEYQFAVKNLPFIFGPPEHRYFRYPLNINWTKISEIVGPVKLLNSKTPRLMLGNSGVYTNNHLDALEQLKESPLEFTLPLSYGSKDYVSFLGREMRNYRNATPFTEFLPFADYIRFLNEHDGVILNTLRPQGVGNIWLGMILGKVIFLNERNMLLPYLQSLGFHVFSIEALKDYQNCISQFDAHHNRKLLLEKFSDEQLDNIYTQLFQ